MSAAAATVGWTVVHFLWQGAAIAALLGLTLGLLRERSANARYLACCAGLALSLVFPIATLVVLVAAPDGRDLALPALLQAVAATPSPRGLDAAMPWIAAVWLAGAGSLQCRTWMLWFRALRMKRSGTRELSAAWREQVDDLCRRVGVRRAVRVVESRLAEVPMLIGWLSPVILIPAASLTRLTPVQLRAVLAHELAHVRRHDALVNLVQAIAESLLFFHPAVWWISDRMRIEREYCCDDVAVAVSGDRMSYARALSTLEDLRALPTAAVASNGGALMHRIFRLAGSRPTDRSRQGVGLIACVLGATLLALTAITVGVAETPAAHAAEPGYPTVSEPSRPEEREPTTAERIAAEKAALEALREAEWREQEARAQARHFERKKRALESDRAAQGGLETERRHLERLQRALELEQEWQRTAEAKAREEFERTLDGADREHAADLERELLQLERMKLALEAEHEAMGERQAAELSQLEQLERETGMESAAAEQEHRRALQRIERDRARAERESERERKHHFERVERERARALERATRSAFAGTDDPASVEERLNRAIERLRRETDSIPEETLEQLRALAVELRERQRDERSRALDLRQRQRGLRGDERDDRRSRTRLEREREEREQAIRELRRRLAEEQRRLEQTLERLETLEDRSGVY